MDDVKETLLGTLETIIQNHFKSHMAGLVFISRVSSLNYWRLEYPPCICYTFCLEIRKIRICHCLSGACIYCKNGIMPTEWRQEETWRPWSSKFLSWVPVLRRFNLSCLQHTTSTQREQSFGINMNLKSHTYVLSILIFFQTCVHVFEQAHGLKGIRIRITYWHINRHSFTRFSEWED